MTCFLNHINISDLNSALKIMGMGMAGIFAVMISISVIVYISARIFSNKRGCKKSS